MASCRSTQYMLQPESNALTRTSSLTKVGLETTDVSLLTLAPLQLLERGSRTLLDAPRGNSIVNLRGLYRHTISSWICYAVVTRYERIYFIYSHVDFLSGQDFAFLMNSWDSELTQYKLHSESNCTKYNSCEIEWSPEISFWLSRRWVWCKPGWGTLFHQ